jgi:hypothetical protein
MNFLAPWFWLGTAAVVGPILFHLLRRSARERLPFSSLMFLSPTPPRAVRRRRLEHFWLLLLRCICLVLLAAGFARPFFSRDLPVPAPATSGRQIILLMDTSASMRRPGVWDEARAAVGRYLAGTGPADQVAVMTFDQQLRTLIGFKEWSSWPANERAELARQRLGSVSPGWMGTQLGLALTGAAEQLMNDPPNAPSTGSRELILITDLQEGARLEGLQGYEWPLRTGVVVERVEAKRRGGCGLEILDESNGQTGGSTVVPVRVANDRDSDQEKFQLAWTEPNGNSGKAATRIYLPPGRTRSVSVPLPGRLTGELRLNGAEAGFDDLSYYVAPENEAVTIAWLGTESADDPAKLRYYLQRAFSFSAGRQVRLISPTNTDSLSELLAHADFAVIPSALPSIPLPAVRDQQGRWLGQSSALPPDQLPAVRDWLNGGKSALLVLTDAQAGPTFAALAGIGQIPLSEATGDYALLGEINFSHPLFAEFADPRFSDFTHIHFWKHRRWEVPAGSPVQVLARFDDGSPALALFSVGKGNLLVLAAGWDPVDSQLAVSSKFVPLMQAMLDWSGAAQSMRHQYRTGESIPSPVSTGGPVQWLKLDGTRKDLAAGEPFTETDRRGIYQATTGARQWSFAVNVPLEESRTAALSPDELARLGVPIATQTEISTSPAPGHLRQLQRAELENRQKIWRWLIGSVLVFALVEIILSGWLARRVKTAEIGA